MPRRAVLFDIGGPIDTETAFEHAIDAAIRAVVANIDGAPIAVEALAEASRRAVASFAPNAYQAMLFTLLGSRAEAAWPMVLAMLPPPGPLELRPGIADLLHDLAARGVPLGLAANQPSAVLARLDAAGIRACFTARDVSGTIGLRKPDPRLFLHACDRLGVAPQDCVMVGDRIDNDIAPARALGMTTIRLRTGRHAAQVPRSWLEVPHADVTDIAGVRAALGELL